MMILIEIHQFYTFYPNIKSPLDFIISGLLTLQILQTKFGQDYPSSYRGLRRLHRGSDYCQSLIMFSANFINQSNHDFYLTT